MNRSGTAFQDRINISDNINVQACQYFLWLFDSRIFGIDSEMRIQVIITILLKSGF